MTHSEATWVTRCIALRPEPSLVELEALCRGLRNKLGVREAALERRGLTLCYDVARVDFARIIDWLAGQGRYPLGRLGRWKARWFAFLDDNVRANAGMRPACCNRPPVT